MIIKFDTKWLDCISDLDDSMRLAIIEAIFTYMEGREPRLSTEAFSLFCMIKPYVDEVYNKQIMLAERSRENGKKGGRKPTKKEKKPGKKFTDYLEEEAYRVRCDKLKALDVWKEKHVPYIYANFAPLTQTQFECLHPKYSSEQICDTLLDLENRKDLRKRYISLYRTLLNWLKRNYDKS